jgi:DNA-binding IclR family transcriptional regulator
MGQVLHGSARTTAAVRRAVQRSQESMRGLAIGLDLRKIVILAQVNSPTSIGFYVKLGSTVDVMEASSGNVILAHQTDEERDRRLTEWKRRNGKKVPTGLEGHLDRIRKAGYEKRANYQVQGVQNISIRFAMSEDPRLRR